MKCVSILKRIFILKGLPGAEMCFKIETMGSVFVVNLRHAMGTAGVNPYRLAQAAGVSEGHIRNVLSMRRDPSPDFINAIAPVVNLSPDLLRAWADIDLLGPDGLERIRKHAPEFLTMSKRGHSAYDVLAQTGVGVDALDDGDKGRGARALEKAVKQAERLLEEDAVTQSLPPKAAPKHKESSPLIGQVLAELPVGMTHPPTKRELELLERIGGFDGSELDPRSGSPLWQESPAKRWPELKLALEEWKEDQDDAGHEAG